MPHEVEIGIPILQRLRALSVRLREPVIMEKLIQVHDTLSVLWNGAGALPPAALEV